VVIARILGPIVATRKHPSHEGRKIFMVQPLDPDGSEVGDVFLALDGSPGVNAGIGDRVLVVQEGWSAATAVGPEGQPIDAAVIGVVDAIELAEPLESASPS
jgi:ethanolamine utilization protein EutN